VVVQDIARPSSTTKTPVIQRSIQELGFGASTII
jgi:hypothetical protein